MIGGAIGPLEALRYELAEERQNELNAAYAEGRADERAECVRLLNWAYGKLQHVSFSKQEDALAMDEIKLMAME